MKEIKVLDILIAIEELLEEGIINQFEEIDNGIIKLILYKAKIIANED